MAEKKPQNLSELLQVLKKDKKLALDEDTIVTGEDVVEVFSTGSLIVDKLLGKKDQFGGVGRGRITEIFGLESTGKTTLALTIAREVQKRGGNVAFVDFESALDAEYTAKAVGVDMSEDRLAWLRPQTLEEGCNLMDALLDNYESSKIDLIIVDSVKAMTPKVVLEGMAGDEPPMAIQARKIGTWLGKLIKTIKNTKTAVVLLNQMTKNIKTNMFSPGGEYETPGGLAVRFYASTRIQLNLARKDMVTTLDEITNEETEMPGSNIVRATIIKNKIGIPYRKGEFYIKYGEGIDNKRSIIDMCVSHNIIEQSGSWYSYNGEKLGQGDAAMREYIMRPENSHLLKEIAGRLTFKQDPEVKKQALALEEEEKKMERRLTKDVREAKKKKEVPAKDLAPTDKPETPLV